MNKLVLIDGPMGAGKTTVCKILEQIQNYKHLDIDSLKVPFKNWPAGYNYKEHLPLIYDLAKSIVKSNLKLTNILVDKTLGLKVSKDFTKFGEELGARVVKIMLWVDLEESKRRAFERQTNQGSDISENYKNMVVGSWEKALDYKNNDTGLIIIDSTVLEPHELAEKINYIVNSVD